MLLVKNPLYVHAEFHNVMNCMKVMRKLNIYRLFAG